MLLMLYEKQHRKYSRGRALEWKGELANMRVTGWRQVLQITGSLCQGK
jgi:hypothetical protein